MYLFIYVYTYTVKIFRNKFNTSIFLCALSTALLSVGFSHKVYLLIQAGDAIFELRPSSFECLFI